MLSDEGEDLDQSQLNSSFVKLYHEEDALVEDSTMDLLILMPREGTILLQSLSPQRTIQQILYDLELLSGFLVQYCTLFKSDGNTPQANDTLSNCVGSSHNRAKIVLRLQIDLQIEHLYTSVLSRDPQEIRSLLSACQDDSYQFAVLFLASHRGHLLTCHHILQQYANQAFGRSTSGRTALHAAAAGNHLEVAQLLIQSGCPSQALDDNRCSAADVARELDGEQVRQLLLKQCTKKSNLFNSHQRAKSATCGQGQALRLFQMPMPGHFDLTKRFKSRNCSTKKALNHQYALQSRPITARTANQTLQLFCGSSREDK